MKDREARQVMREETEVLVKQLKGKYRVRESFIAEIAPLVEKIYSGNFSESKRTVLLSLAEDAFRREEEIFSQQLTTAKALGEMCQDLQQQCQEMQSIEKTLVEAAERLRSIKVDLRQPVNRWPMGPSMN